MELFRRIRLKAGRYVLSRRLSRANRKVSYTSINHVKNILVVWDASKPEDFASLSKFYLRMQERGINVDILGYYPGDSLPDQYTAIRYFTCIRRNELNYYYFPVLPEAEKLIKTPYDVLIDINFEQLLPLLYISELSEAHFKAGLSDSQPEKSPFDLLMNINKPVSIDNYLTQVMHYLEMINSGTEEKV
ncbi:MAG: hypothetical protein R6W81_04185 [Bacteroidales bacterium]